MKAPILVAIASCALFAACHRADEPRFGAENPTNNAPGTSDSYPTGSTATAPAAASGTGEIASPAMATGSGATGLNSGGSAGAGNEAPVNVPNDMSPHSNVPPPGTTVPGTGAGPHPTTSPTAGQGDSRP